MARYFGQNLLSTADALTGYLKDRAVSVPVPEGSSQGLRPRFTTTAREATEEKLDVPEYDTAMVYLWDNGWWNIARPVNTAEDIARTVEVVIVMPQLSSV